VNGSTVKKLTLNKIAYKTGLRLAQIRFVKSAIDDRADLSAFKEPPNWRIFLGMFLIALSFVMCWPVITPLMAMSVYWGRPWIGVVGSTIIYGLSHLTYLAGMYLCGAKYSLIVFRWMTRVGVEKLLSFGRVRELIDPLKQVANPAPETPTR